MWVSCSWCGKCVMAREVTIYKDWKEYIYTPGEARAKGIEWIEDWQRAEEGQWLLTTDGYIIKCLRRNYTMSGGKKYWYIRTCIGTFSTCRSVCDTIPRKSRYSFSGKRTWDADVVKKNCGAKERAFATRIASLLINGRKDWRRILVEAFLFAHPKIDRRKYPDKVIIRSAENLYQRKHVFREVAKIVGNPEVVGEVTNEWLLKKGKELLEKAIKAKDYKNAPKLLLELCELKKKIDQSGPHPESNRLNEERMKQLEEQKQAELAEKEKIMAEQEVSADGDRDDDTHE